jgi:hypothetical protein
MLRLNSLATSYLLYLLVTVVCWRLLFHLTQQGSYMAAQQVVGEGRLLLIIIENQRSEVKSASGYFNTK